MAKPRHRRFLGRSLGRRLLVPMVALWTWVAGWFARPDRRTCLISSVRGISAPHAE